MGVRWVVQVTPDRALTVEVLSDAEHCTRVRVEEPGQPTKELSLDLARLPHGRLLSRNGAQHVLVDAVRRSGTGHWALRYGKTAFDVEVRGERDTWLSGGGQGAAAGKVTVAMPGKVVFIDTAVGSAVTKGQRLLVIEAMKMENDVKSPRDGVVKAVLCKVGDAVEGGATLVEVE